MNMCIGRVIFFVALFNISCDVFSINAAIKQKYPYVLLTNDYGILNENDLASHTWGVQSTPFTISVKKGYALNYWQCFPRENVTVTLEAMGNSASELCGDTYADLTITVGVGHGVVHEYYMRRAWGLENYHLAFNQWLKLMKSEKYVCLAGLFSGREEYISNNKKWIKYHWTFDKIKTKKGCDSFFGGRCNRTYKQFLQGK